MLTLQVTMQTHGNPLPMGNPNGPQEDQLSVPDESLAMETDSLVEHPSPWTNPVTTPVVSQKVGIRLDHSELIRTCQETTSSSETLDGQSPRGHYTSVPHRVEQPF